MKKTGYTKLNFGAGPAALPQEILQQASEAIIEYKDTGLSILEIPHRSNLFDDILEESKALVHELCGLGDDYEMVWMQGGGRHQFCMIPMNFLTHQSTAGYIDSGNWSTAAAESAQYYGNVKVLSSSRDKDYNELPAWPSDIPEDLAYIHLTTNNTLYGTQWTNIPKTEVPLVADMSSDILCRKRDYSNYALFYAVAQKNLGAAGNTLVVVRKDQLKRVNPGLPHMLDYNIHVQRNSVLNTPPVFAIYTSLLMLRWVKQKGIDTVEAENMQKAALLYGEIERNEMFTTKVKPGSRSIMNVHFVPVNDDVAPFLEFCEHNNITGVKGHRFTGGFRVSLYNAIPLTAVQQLITVMQEFEHKYKNQPILHG